MTTDGGSDERGAAVSIVKEGSALLCAALINQLVVGDSLDAKKSKPYPKTATHRTVLLKAHNLVILVRAHYDTTQHCAVSQNKLITPFLNYNLEK